MGRRNEHSREELKDLALRAAGDIVAESGAAALVHARSRAPHRLHRRRAVHRLRRISTTSSCISTSRRSWSCALRSSESAAARTSRRRICVCWSLRIWVSRCCTPRAGGSCSSIGCLKGRRLPRPTQVIPPRSSRWSAQRLREAEITHDAASTAELATALWSGAHGICMLAVTGKLQVATQASVQTPARRAARQVSRRARNAGCVKARHASRSDVTASRGAA